MSKNFKGGDIWQILCNCRSLKEGAMISIKGKQNTRVTGILIVAILAILFGAVIVNAQDNVNIDNGYKIDIKNYDKSTATYENHIIDDEIVAGAEKELKDKNDSVELDIVAGSGSVLFDDENKFDKVDTILPEAGSGELNDNLVYFILTTDGILEESEDWMDGIINPKPKIIDADLDMYATTKLNVRSEPTTDSEAIDRLHIKDKIKVTGIVDDKWARIELKDGTEAYVSREYISDSIASIEAPTYNKEYTSNKKSLNGSKGSVNGPSGKETYYNLDMSRIINNMRSKGYTGEYWIRSDGAKMLGDYVMVAANLTNHPRGSLVETSMGTGIVVDTGDFAKKNPTQIDIATNW